MIHKRVRRTYASRASRRVQWIAAAGVHLDQMDATVRQILTAEDTPPPERTPAQRRLLAQYSSRKEGEWWRTGIVVLVDMMEQISLRVDRPHDHIPPPQEIWDQIIAWSRQRLAERGLHPGQAPHIEYARLLDAEVDAEQVGLRLVE